VRSFLYTRPPKLRARLDAVPREKLPGRYGSSPFALHRHEPQQSLTRLHDETIAFRLHESILAAAHVGRHRPQRGSVQDHPLAIEIANA
jgi:hypothetical protein